MATPKLSIVIPVYNAEEYLNDCINSIINQPFQNFEIILIDDGSVDSSPQICDNFVAHDRRIQVVHKNNGGASEARNIGIKKAKGKYLMFMDSDDKWLDSINLENYINFLDNNLDIDILIFRFYLWFYKTDNKSISTEFPKETLNINTSPLTKCESLLSSGLFPVSPCDKIMRVSIFQKYDLLFKVGTTCEDIIWLLDIFKYKVSFVCNNDSFYLYRKGVVNSVSSSPKSIRDLAVITFMLADKHKQDKSTLGQIILGFMAYEYLILLGYSSWLPIEQSSKLIDYRWLLDYDTNKKVQYANRVMKIIGFHGVVFLLQQYLKYAKKVKL